MEAPEVIVPEPRHAEQIARLSRSTYEETFIGVSYYTRELVEGYTRATFTADAILRDLADPAIRFLLATLDGAAAGYAKAAERAPPACLAGQPGLYLERLYIDARCKRRGLGALLLQAVYAEARARGYARVWLSVWEHNPAAQAFYKARGYREAGEWEWVFESLGTRFVDRDLIYVVDHLQ